MQAFRKAALPAALAGAALVLGACGSSGGSAGSAGTAAVASPASATSAAVSSPSSPVTLAGRTVSVAVNPLAGQVLTQSGIAITPIAPATSVAGNMVFPITGGRIVPASLAGTIESGGGVTIAHMGRSVAVTGFTIDTAAHALTGMVAGHRVPMFALGMEAATHSTGAGGAIVIGGVALTVTAQSAAAMNAALGVRIFSAGLPFGVATVTAVPGPAA